MPRLDTTIELVELQCGNCGVYHAIPKAMHDTCVEEGGFWHCPNGHSRGYREGRREREAVRLERDRLKQQLAERDDKIATLKKSAAAVRGEYTKIKNRVAAGVCPCCNRSFENLYRHMKTKHPEFTAEVVPLKTA